MNRITNRLKRTRSFALLFALMLLVVTLGLAPAAQADDRDDAKGLVSGMVAAVYAFAWPTATYKSVSLNAITPMRNGYDVEMRLLGTSGLSGEDLWMDLVFEVRNGALHDMYVRRHNAIVAPPFSTMKALGEVLEAMIEDSRAPSQPPVVGAPGAKKAGAVCLHNPTDAKINIRYRWGDGEWVSLLLDPGNNKWFWHAYKAERQNSPPFQVQWDGRIDDGDTVTVTHRVLTRWVATMPVKCENARGYTFVVQGGALALRSNEWLPGWPNPWFENVIAGEKENKWKPAPGYRWYDTSNPKDMNVIKNDRGVIGVHLRKTETDQFPLVMQVVKDSPAYNAGVLVDMQITRINGVSTVGKDLDNCLLLISGAIGTTVDIEFTAKGSGRVRVMRLTRK